PVGPHARLDTANGEREAGMTATGLDGRATLGTIKSELKQRIADLRDRGGVPGLGTVPVGDDPASTWYVNAKHNDCAEGARTSTGRGRPAPAGKAEVEAVVAELNADPACTAYLVQLLLPAGLDEYAVLERIDPGEDVDGLHPVNLGRLVLNKPAPLPCTPA